MSFYDMSAKRAERLLRRNWASAQAEAHKLGSLELPGSYVQVVPECITLHTVEQVDYTTYSITVDIWPDGQVSAHIFDPGCQGEKWMPEHSAQEKVSEALSLMLIEAHRRASDMGQVAQELAKAG